VSDFVIVWIFRGLISLNK